MRSWSLKVKVGAYSALLTVVALCVTALVIMPLVRHQQIRQLDAALENLAEEFHHDLRNFQPNPTGHIPTKLVPVDLRERYLMVRDSVGRNLYRSPNLLDAELMEGPVGTKTVELLGEKCRVGTFREGQYLIQIGASLESIEQFQGTLRWGYLMTLPVVGVVVFIGGIWLGRRAVAPVTDLTVAAERISAERPNERLPDPPAKDEIARLTEVLNDSFDRMQSSYEAARRFSADASHQLKTPVSVLRVGLGVRAGVIPVRVPG